MLFCVLRVCREIESTKRQEAHSSVAERCATSLITAEKASFFLCEVASNLESPRRGAVAVALGCYCSYLTEKRTKEARGFCLGLLLLAPPAGRRTSCLRQARHHGLHGSRKREPLRGCKQPRVTAPGRCGGCSQVSVVRDQQRKCQNNKGYAFAYPFFVLAPPAGLEPATS